MQHYTNTSINPSDYSVAKTRTKWSVMLNGQQVEGFTWLSRKGDALSAIPEIVELTAYRQRILHEDATGHVWTDEEFKQIAEYAEMLRENKILKSLFGDRSIAEAGRAEHYSEFNTIQSHYAFGDGPSSWGSLVCAEIRRRRAARSEAYQQAGVLLDQCRYAYTGRRTNHPTKETKPYTYDHRTVADRDAAVATNIRIGNEHGEMYEFSIFTIEPAFPYVCTFYQTVEQTKAA
jgi:hypothetical protein